MENVLLSLPCTGTPDPPVLIVFGFEKRDTGKNAHIQGLGAINRYITFPCAPFAHTHTHTLTLV